MICRHCGKEVPEFANFCPNCAEPVPKPEKTLDEAYVDKRVGAARLWSIIGGVSLQLFALVVMGPVLGLIFGAMVFPISIWAIIYGTRKRTLEDVKANKRETVIAKQYAIDPTSICPHCGSHNIKIYRKGYNYKMGFWGSVFGVRGAGYAAGFDSNTACCRCMNCGNDWETNYDYRLINK